VLDALQPQAKPLDSCPVAKSFQLAQPLLKQDVKVA
jgi:hypothetical protein